MLSFATEFPVQETNSDRFVDAVRKWILGSPHTTFTDAEISSLPAEGRWKIQTDNSRLEALFIKVDQSEIASFKFTAVDGYIEWVTEVTYSKSEIDDWIGIRTSRESSRPQVSLPPAKKPFLVKTIINELGGGLDGELYVSDKPHYLKEQDVRMAVRLLNADAENYLPLVYVSAPFFGEITVDPKPLARTLGGLAHVIVEPSRGFSRNIQREVGSRNVYGGSVGVYWPNGERYRYFLGDQTSNEFDVRQSLVADIRAAHINRRPLARCTWSRAEVEVARAAFEALKNSGSEDVAEYVAAFDAEINAKNRQLSEAEDEVSRLKEQIRFLKSRSFVDSETLSYGSEQQLRDGEFNEILKEALEAAAANAQDDSRRQHVLLAVASAIPRSTTLMESRDRIKKALKKYTNMDGNVRQELESLGFEIEEDGKHYKIIYMSDDRYTFSLPKSGSDWRGGMNAASDISKRVF